MGTMTIRVLVVDDDDDFRDGIVGMLEEAQFIEVTGTASDGRSGIVAVKEQRPDVVLMDINMPGFDGLTATKFISEVSPGTKIVAVSSYVDAGHVKSMLDAGAAGYLSKTRIQSDLLPAIHAVDGDQLFMSPNIDGGVLREYR